MPACCRFGEGYDEPFHFGYVQHLWSERSLPVQRRTRLSEEVWQSLTLAPASYIVKRNLPMVASFDDYFRLPSQERTARRERLEHLDPRLAAVPFGAPNYEALQAPLAYAILAPFHELWKHAPLPARVLRLRLVCALASVLATALLTLRLAERFSLDRASQYAAVFALLSTQMFYASTAHITNNWLVLPLWVLLLTAAIDSWKEPGRGRDPARSDPGRGSGPRPISWLPSHWCSELSRCIAHARSFLSATR